MGDVRDVLSPVAASAPLQVFADKCPTPSRTIPGH
jgi:hypothetical protein